MARESNKPHYLGHRKRLREKFERFGLEALQDYEIIELLLTFSLPRKDTKPIAKQLLNKFGSIKGIFEASPEELRLVPFIKDKTINLINFIKEISAFYHKEKIQEKPLPENLPELADYCIKKFGNKQEEEFHVIYLDSKYYIIREDLSFPAREFYFKGTVDKVPVYPRKIIEEALKLKSSALVIIHNHPDGNLTPSEYDIALTKTLDIACKSLDIILYDHLIVSSNSYLSFREKRLL
ncbi:MAG: hypothetical protein DRP72_02470 [Candidatus Omnitrophota bacterium]|nr:MAG: hypothetical protein DRP72_02470 [Candidatus Omnitrophota bacterium]